MESTDQELTQQIEVDVRASRALKMWTGLLIAVLFLLFLETRGRPRDDFNFFINTNSEAIGAQVSIDQKPAGVVGKSGEKGIGGGTFWASLTDGKHRVELTKADCKPFQTEIDLHEEAYLGVDLQPLTH